MKTNTKILLFLAVLLSACNDQNQNKKHHVEENKNQAAVKYVMVSVMDQSMKEMHETKQTGNPDYDFAAMMIPHHRGAVAMADVLVKEGKSPELVDFGRRVIEEQQKEINIFTLFLKGANQTPVKDAAAFKKAFSATMAPMMEVMGQYKATGNMERDFIALMVPHHQSAVDMAKVYLPYAINANMKLLAEQIIKTQEEEIKWLTTKSYSFR